MARPSKNAIIDFTVSHDLTHGLLDRAVCPLGKSFVLIKDAEKKGLRLRVTAAGGKHWQFETRVKGKLFTRALGEDQGGLRNSVQSALLRLQAAAPAGRD